MVSRLLCSDALTELNLYTIKLMRAVKIMRLIIFIMVGSPVNTIIKIEQSNFYAVHVNHI